MLITLNMQQYVDTGYKFSYYGLRVDEVSVNDGPPGGVASGGTIVTLRGLGFEPLDRRAVARILDSY